MQAPPLRHFALEVAHTMHRPGSPAPGSERVWGSAALSGAPLLFPVPPTAPRASACGRAPHSALFPGVRVSFYLGLGFIGGFDPFPTMSLTSLPASCPSKRTCKYGQQSPPTGPGQSVSMAGGAPRGRLVSPSVPHFSETCSICLQAGEIGVQGFWGSAPPPGAPSPAESWV